MQTTNNGPEPLDQLGITVPKFIKRMRLVFEYREDRIGRCASFDGSGKWVIAEILASAFGVFGQGGVEERCEVG